MDHKTPVRGRITLYLILLAVAVAMMFMLRECSVRNIYGRGDRPSSGDTLDVAIEYAPMSLYRYADTLGGFNYDMVRAISARTGMPVKFHPLTTASQGVQGLAQGRYDMVVAAVAQTTEMKSRVLFTEPSFLDRQVLVQMPDSATGKPAVVSQLDLAGLTVWVPEDSPALERLNNLSREIGDSIHIATSPEYGSEQLFMLTALGQIPLAVVNESAARRLKKDYPDVDISVGISFTQFQSWMVAKDNKALADSLDKAIVAFKDTPAYRRLVKRYMR